MGFELGGCQACDSSGQECRYGKATYVKALATVPALD